MKNRAQSMIKMKKKIKLIVYNVFLPFGDINIKILNLYYFFTILMVKLSLKGAQDPVDSSLQMKVKA